MFITCAAGARGSNGRTPLSSTKLLVFRTYWLAMITGHGAARRRRDRQTPPLCAVGGGCDAQRPTGTERPTVGRGERGVLCAATDDTSRDGAVKEAGVCRGARRHDESVLAEDLHAGEDEGGRLRAAEQHTLFPESSPLQFSMATPRRLR